MIATVLSTTIGESKSGDGKVVMCECELSEKEDIRTVEIVAGHGRMVSPKPQSKLIGMKLQNGYIVAVSCDDGIEPDIEEGEHRIYSIGPDGSIAANILMKADGSIVLNDGTDYAVLFSEMKNAFNELKSDFNGHKHPLSVTGSATAQSGTSGAPMVKSAANMSSAKASKVRL